MAKRKRRAFTKEFKAQTVWLMRDSDKSIRVLAPELDLGETVLRTWVRQAEAHHLVKREQAFDDLPPAPTQEHWKIL